MRLPWRKEQVSAERFERARAAVDAAQGHLDQVRAREPEVRALAARLRLLREHNHFADGLRAMLAEEGRDHAPHA